MLSKKAVKIALALVLSLSFSAQTFAKTIVYQINNPEMVLDDKVVAVDSSGSMPIIKDSKTLVPLRSAIEAIGGSLIWEANSKKIVINMTGDTSKNAKIVISRDSDSKELSIKESSGDEESANSFLTKLNSYLGQNPNVSFDVAVALMGGRSTLQGNDLTIDITPGTRSVEMWVNKNYAYVNGAKLTLDVPPQIINDRTMVPLRFVSESTGYTVDWEPVSRQILVYDGAEPDNLIDLETP